MSDSDNAIGVAAGNTSTEIVGVCGLINLGNTCYLNSSIQIMRAIPEWAAFCTDYDVSGNTTSQAPMLKSYIDLTRGMWGQRKPMICRPALFLKDLRVAVRGTIYEQFASPIPNDGHEFMQYMLDQFHEALKMPGPQAAEDATPAVKAWCELWRRDYSPLVNMVFGLDQVQCICSSCGKISTRYETFNMLKVGLNPDRGVSFRDLFNAEREITEIEDYACEACAPVRRPAKIVRRLWRLPRNIMLVFRRFNENRTKNSAAIPNCSAVNFKEFFAADSPDESAGWSYDPIATLDHFGNHMGGHYSAQTYNCVMKKWYLYDDTNVNDIPAPQFGSSTYMVLLRRHEA